MAESDGVTKCNRILTYLLDFLVNSSANLMVWICQINKMWNARLLYCHKNANLLMANPQFLCFVMY